MKDAFDPVARTIHPGPGGPIAYKATLTATGARGARARISWSSSQCGRVSYTRPPESVRAELIAALVERLTAAGS